jgi:F-type H+-transporting ATPase subunit alpha
MLKQANGAPLSVGLQVASIYAVNNGYIDHVHVPDVVAWEKGMHSFMNTAYKDLLTSLNKDWSEDLETALKDALASYAESSKHSA